MFRNSKSFESAYLLPTSSGIQSGAVGFVARHHVWSVLGHAGGWVMTGIDTFLTDKVLDLFFWGYNMKRIFTTWYGIYNGFDSS